ncbi:DUF4198 domain-containing protein [Limnoglobus roseus]|uniref:DUF4198 domain-containing protein n=1 Tax=Limnoglobus roseus TaxID=2598579 RepID=A0A5C1AUW2_9BACT|nr:DUF4198 domain-containing protein [Limnoglobus roseus]QEL21054.1 hypothetical protein PX52LOC_08183 [Limnoglobus roseus]
MRFLSALILAAAFAAMATAHFVYVVPAKDGKTVQVVMSENLDPDDNVTMDKVNGLKLTARLEDGKEVPVTHKAGPHALTADVPAHAKLLHGTVIYGMLSRKDAKPALLVYHPKAILDGCDQKTATVGEKAALEIVPVTAAGKTSFHVHGAGKPVADVELSVLLPDGKATKLKTDKDGKTEPVTGAGRYGIWARHIEPKAGEHDGKKYEEVRHYATLVVDLK